jgi:hypothetical protein
LPVIVGVIVVLQSYADKLNDSNLATMQVTSEVRLRSDPHFQTFRAIQNAEELNWELFSGEPVWEGLRRPWGLAKLSAADAAGWLGPGRFADSGSYWSENAGGGVVRWDVARGASTEIHQLAQGRIGFAMVVIIQKLVSGVRFCS